MPDLSPDIERELTALEDALAGRRVAPDLTELGELALALRDERPRIDDDFGRLLDTRVERGFPAGDPRKRVSRRSWTAWFSAPMLGTAATVLLVALIVALPGGGVDEEGGGGGGASAGGGSGGMTAADDAGGGREAAGGAAASQASAESAGGAEPAPDADFDAPVTSLAPGPVPPAPRAGSPATDGRAARKVERSASLTLAARPRDIDAVSARVQEVTRQQGGFVVASTVSSSAGGGGGTFELRVPARNLDAAMAALSRLGNVRERSQRAQDITAQAVSARSRLTDARTERKSLLRQLGEAVTLEETESIRARLRDVSREIERARAGLRRVNNRAAFSTVVVTLVADRAVGAGSEDDDAWTPGDAAHDALRVLEVAAGVALIVLAVALPLAVLAALAALAARWATRRRRERALDAV